MKLTHDSSDRDDRESFPDKPGSLLKKARTAISLSQIDLATRLRLDVRLIEALESDDYEALPAPMFVKGYIRSIAKELGVPADPFLTAYEFHGPQEAPALTDFETRAPIQITSSNTLVKGVTFGVVIVLVVMVGLWWHGRSAEWQAAFPRAGLSADSDRAPAAPPDPEPIPLPYSYPVVEHPAEADFSFPVDAPEPLEALAGDASMVAPEAAAPGAGTGSGDIVLEADENAWVEIYDDAGRRLFYGMATPGAAVTVGGQRPFALVIGNSTAVTLSYRGRAVDLTQYSVRGIARLTLGDIED